MKTKLNVARKIWRIGLGIAMLAIFSLPLLSFAEATIQEIKVSSPTSNTVTVSPQAGSTDAAPNVGFHVVNDTNNPVNFSIPKLGISYYVAPQTEPTFFVNITPQMAQNISYYVQDTSGNQLIAGNIVNEGSTVATLPTTDTSNYYQEKYASTQQQQVAVQPQQQEPSYQQPQRPVRGYW
jgi:hypothetical protein